MPYCHEQLFSRGHVVCRMVVKELLNSVNQIPIFLLALPQKVKYSKVNQIQPSADIASGNSLVVSAVLPLQPTNYLIGAPRGIGR